MNISFYVCQLFFKFKANFYSFHSVFACKKFAFSKKQNSFLKICLLILSNKRCMRAIQWHHFFLPHSTQKWQARFFLLFSPEFSRSLLFPINFTVNTDIFVSLVHKYKHGCNFCKWFVFFSVLFLFLPTYFISQTRPSQSRSPPFQLSTFLPK